METLTGQTCEKKGFTHFVASLCLRSVVVTNFKTMIKIIIFKCNITTFRHDNISCLQWKKIFEV